jgi:hypothetical protein
VLERGDRAVAGKRAVVPTGGLARVQGGGEDLTLGDAQLDPAADQARVERVVVAIDADVRVGCDPGHQTAVDVGHALGQRPHHLKLLGQPVDRPAAERAVEAHVGALFEPAVELLLVVELVGETPARLEARLQIALQPLDDALRLRIARLEEAPADLQLTAEGGEGLGRAADACVQRSLPVPDERLRQRTQLGEALADPVQEVGCFLREDERAGAGARVGQAAHDDVAAPGLAGADRDLRLGSQRSNWQITPGQ